MAAPIESHTSGKALKSIGGKMWQRAEDSSGAHVARSRTRAAYGPDDAPQTASLRARIVPACGKGTDNKVVAAKLRCPSKLFEVAWTLRDASVRWPLDARRPGAPRSIADTRVDVVIAKALASVLKYLEDGWRLLHRKHSNSDRRSI